MKSHRVIVLGLGGIGSGAAYWAARRLGDEVLGIEQFGLGHSNGGSEDHSRIIRLSYHTPQYVELARAAYAAWSQLEGDSGRQVVLQTGGLDLAPAGATIGLHDYESAMTVAEVPFERLATLAGQNQVTSLANLRGIGEPKAYLEPYSEAARGPATIAGRNRRSLIM